MKITEKKLRQIIREEIISKKTNINKVIKREIDSLIDEGIFDSLFGDKKKQQRQQTTQQPQQKQSNSLSTQDVGGILNTIDQNVKKLAKNAEEEDMLDVAEKIQQSGDEFLDDIKDSGMLATQDYSKKGMFDKKKKFKGAPQKNTSNNNNDDEDIFTSAK